MFSKVLCVTIEDDVLPPPVMKPGSRASEVAVRFLCKRVWGSEATGGAKA